MVGPRHLVLDESTGSVPREHGMFNVNGPSVIRTPEWLPGRRGRYHLYFAHHLGDHIRLAHADGITGPWSVHDRGVLDVVHTPSAGDFPHVASPDVHIDEENRRLVMYFHCLLDDPELGGHLPCWDQPPTVRQKSLVAVSPDGLSFELAHGRPVAPSYLRMFRWAGAWYGIAMPGQLVRSPDGLDDFEYGPTLFAADDPVRHCAVRVDGDRLRIWFTRKGDAPERIMATTVDLVADWRDWRTTAAVEVLRPTEPWEGAEIEVAPSEAGAAFSPQNALRDPYVLDDEGHRWLFYSGQGEFTLGATELAAPRR